MMNKTSMNTVSILKRWLILLVAMTFSSTGFAHGGEDHGAPAVDEVVATSATVSEMTVFGEVEQFTLRNGLRVIVHEDRNTPMVSVRVMYHVGSKQEPPGKTGFAHLFEHIMFRGSENVPGNFYKLLREAGARSPNGFTTNDVTVYYETVPSQALELALWLESDRMGYLLGALTQEALDDERGIVQNEKRQREAQPYAATYALAMQALFPVGHPYHHPVIGSMEDLNAASLEDMHAWFKQYYGASNALVVLVGDIDAAAARPLMEKYFEDIEPGDQLLKRESWIPQRELNIRETITDKNAGSALVQRSWAVPEYASHDRVLLDVTASILGGDKTSRLHRTLIDEQGLATKVESYIVANEIAGVFEISATVKEGADAQEVARVIDAVVAEYLKNGPTQEELDDYRHETQIWTSKLEDFNKKSEIWSSAVLYAGGVEFVGQHEEWVAQAKPKMLRRTAERWLSTGYHQVTVLPRIGFTAASRSLDRSQQPQVDNTMVVDFPTIQEAMLSNGMKVVLAERPSGATLEMAMVFRDVGHGVSDSSVTARMMFAIMNKGPQGMTAAEYADKTRELGLSVTGYAGYADFVVDASVLKKNLRESLALWARTMRRPALREEDFERARDSMSGDAKQSIEGLFVGNVILPELVFGKGHPSTWPSFNEEEMIKAATFADVRAFHDAAPLRPDDAILLAVGDTSLADLVAELEVAFGDWKPSSRVSKPLPKIEDVAAPNKPRIVLVDVPGESQAVIMAGRIVPAADKGLNFDAAHYALTGDMGSRIPANLRDDKGWAYSVFGWLVNGRQAQAQRMWNFAAPVQVDKTADAFQEILKEIKAFSDERPITEAELALFVKSTSRALPAMLASNMEVLRTMQISLSKDRPYDWIEKEVGRLEGLRLADVQRASRHYFKPETMTWVVLGELAKIEQDIRDLDIGTVEVWNNKGHKIR